MPQQTVYNTEPNNADRIIEAKKMDLDAGLLGKVFGADNKASTNITGIVVVLLVISGISLLFVDSKMPAAEYWKVITPIITLALGYLFGKNAS